MRCYHLGLYIKDCKVACSNLLVQPNNLKVRITNIFIFSHSFVLLPVFSITFLILYQLSFGAMQFFPPYIV